MLKISLSLKKPDVHLPPQKKTKQKTITKEKTTTKKKLFLECETQ